MGETAGAGFMGTKKRGPTLSFALCWLVLVTMAGTVFGAAPGALDDDVITMAERQQLMGGDDATPVPAKPPPSPATKKPPPAPPPSAPQATPDSRAPVDWFSHHGLYIAMLLALGGMLVSSLLAHRISRERDAARQANRLKSDFLASVSHEIRTPMNAILGFTQILKAQIVDERQRQYINAIDVSGNTLLRLINDLLDLAKIESGKFELQPTVVALKSIALEIQTIFIQVVEEKRLDFQVDLDPALPEAILIDEVRLRQILFNLLKNAVKFTDQGRISLSMRVLAQGPGERVDLELAVADTGIGIPQEEQATIFEAFTQRKSQSQAKYAGTGLGLSIARRLVETIGGELSLVSEVGQGSTFTAVLRQIPLASREDMAAASEVSEDPKINFDQEAVILVIDAIDSNRMVFREFLRPSKLAVVETVSVEAGIDWCMAIKPDLIVLDYTMAYSRDDTLVERFNRVKEELNIPVVAVTTAAARVGSEDFRTDFHFDAWLQKPVLQDDFYEVLARFLPHSTLSPQSHGEGFGDFCQPYALPGEEQVAAALAAVGERLPELRRILADKMAAQYRENRETFIISEIKSFALEVGKLALEYELDFLRLWAKELLAQAKSFDMERLPQTFDLFPQLIALIEQTDPWQSMPDLEEISLNLLEEHGHSRPDSP